MRAIIVGGGIGGLTAALALHRVGIDVRVFESAAEIRPLGVGINLLPHAVQWLDELGVSHALMETAIQPTEVLYCNKFGQRIWTDPRTVDSGTGSPQLSMLRGELQMVLLREVERRLGAQAVSVGHHLHSLRTHEGGVECRFVDRRSNELLSVESADFLVGADGIHSAVRGILHPQAAPLRWNGQVIWRGVTVATPFLSGRSVVFAGHSKQKFIAYPVSRRHEDEGMALINWVAGLRSDPAAEFPPEEWNRTGKLEDFLPRFESWKFDWLDVPQIIRNADVVYQYPLVDRDPLSRWTSGAATLLGDAAHPMVPLGSNGATQAILDSRALGKHLARETSVESALRNYEEERRPRTTDIVLDNRRGSIEVVLQMAEDRAPGGFDDIESVIPRAELSAIAQQYRRRSGFDSESMASPTRN